MPRGRKPIDPNIRIARQTISKYPTPYVGPIERQQIQNAQDEARAKRALERLAEIRAVSKDERESS